MNPKQHDAMAKKATITPLGDYVVNVGMDKPLADYSREEIEGLVATVVEAYQQKLKDIYSEDIPF